RVWPFLLGRTSQIYVAKLSILDCHKHQCDGLRVSSVTACTFPLRRSARFHCDGSRFHHFFPRAACLSVTSAAPPPLIKANPSRNTTKRLKLRPCPERRGGAPHHQAARNDFLQHRRFFA